MTARGEFQKALAMFKFLRPGTLKEKNVLLLKMRAEQDLDEKEHAATLEELRTRFPDDHEKEYAATLEELRTRFPDDHAVDALSIDYYFMRKEYGKVVECIDRLDQSVGGDPYLKVVRARMEIRLNNKDLARRDLLRAVEEEPDLPDSYLVLARMTANDGKYDEVVGLLEKLDQLVPSEMSRLLHQPVFARFVQSAQYRQWTDSLKEKAARPNGGQPAPASHQPLSRDQS